MHGAVAGQQAVTAAPIIIFSVKDFLLGGGWLVMGHSTPTVGAVEKPGHEYYRGRYTAAEP